MALMAVTVHLKNLRNNQTGIVVCREVVKAFQTKVIMRQSAL